MSKVWDDKPWENPMFGGFQVDPLIKEIEETILDVLTDKIKKHERQDFEVTTESFGEKPVKKGDPYYRHIRPKNDQYSNIQGKIREHDDHFGIELDVPPYKVGLDDLLGALKKKGFRIKSSKSEFSDFCGIYGEGPPKTQSHEIKVHKVKEK